MTAAATEGRVDATEPDGNLLRARRLGIDTHEEHVAFMREDCPVCRSEGIRAHARVHLRHGADWLIATMYRVSAGLLAPGEVGLSESAWARLGVAPGAEVAVGHSRPLDSLGKVRGKIYGRRLDAGDLAEIIRDIVAGRYADLHLASFLTACSARPLDGPEVEALTRAMVDSGQRLVWDAAVVADKHSIGGLPGNRTTPVVVAIAAACGLVIPKTSSRAITSPAGTADTMATIAPVDLDIAAMRRVVEREGGCIVAGGTVRLSPADDILIRVERALDLDSEGQLIASVLSKKIAAGATHLVLDLPVGPTAKVRGHAAAEALAGSLLAVAETFGLRSRTLLSDGTQPVGCGIGPALEALDVLAVLRGAADAPADLRARSLALAGALIELTGAAPEGAGTATAAAALDDGRALAKFERICEAQGGLRTPPRAPHQRPVTTTRAGRVRAIDNRRLARIAKLAGAPDAPAAGIELRLRVGDRVERDQPLYVLHAESPGELAYALEFAAAGDGATIEIAET